MSLVKAVYRCHNTLFKSGVNMTFSLYLAVLGGRQKSGAPHIR